MPNLIQLFLTPASAAAVRGANFATAKSRDAYGSPLEAIVMYSVTINLMSVRLP